MKKFILTIILLCGFAAFSPVFAQISEKNQSELYFVNIPVEKIYLYRSGYIVLYRQGVNRIGTTYIPHEWFTLEEGKAELVTLPSGREWPTMSICYKEGEFSHLRLYTHRWKGHRSWGALPMSIKLDEKFKDIETLEIEF